MTETEFGLKLKFRIRSPSLNSFQKTPLPLDDQASQFPPYSKTITRTLQGTSVEESEILPEHGVLVNNGTARLGSAGLRVGGARQWIFHRMHNEPMRWDPGELLLWSNYMAAADQTQQQSYDCDDEKDLNESVHRVR